MEELRFADLELRLAELRGPGALDDTTEIARHELHPVTDAERRDPEREDVDVELGRPVGEHRAVDDTGVPCPAARVLGRGATLAGQSVDRRIAAGVEAGSPVQSISPRRTAASVSETVSPSNSHRPVSIS